MFGWRITKYNPKYRDNQGFYTKDEWTCYSDIGKIFEGKKFTFKYYLEMENSYIQSIFLFMEYLKLDSLKISYLEKDGICRKKVFIDGILIEKNQDVSKKKLIPLIQLILRREVWCKFETKDMYVHFGYDYYMYVGSMKNIDNSIIDKLKQMGLFVEYCKSPYLNVEE